LCFRDGCKVSLGFFHDVVIPDYALQNPSFFHDTERVWYWQYGDDKLPMDPGQEIRFRVSSIRFNPMPTAAQQAAAAAAAATAAPGAAGTSAGGAAAAVPAAVAPIVYSPMEIVGDIDADGLGLTEWWLPAQEEGEGGADAAEAADVDMAAADEPALAE
jgi:DNA-directed RNA polymerase III subunit RPC8